MISPVEFAVLFLSGGGFFLAGVMTEKANARRTHHDMNVAKSPELPNCAISKEGEREANVSRHLSRVDLTMGDVHEDFAAVELLGNGEGKANVSRHLRRELGATS